MAVTSKEISGKGVRRTSIFPRSVGSAAYLVTFALAALAIYVLVGTVVEWGRCAWTIYATAGHGTTHLEGYVGHGEEAAGRPRG